jgi:hypothetical protein
MRLLATPILEEARRWNPTLDFERRRLAAPQLVERVLVTGTLDEPFHWLFLVEVQLRAGRPEDVDLKTRRADTRAVAIPITISNITQ